MILDKELINFLTDKIEIILKENSSGLSEYELISELKPVLEQQFEVLDLQDSHQLFQIHFMVLHCLYKLRDRWLEGQVASLQINPMKISLLPYSKSMKDELAEADQLRNYYLDLNHLHNTDAEAAENLITDFWVKFAASSDHLDALAVLDLEHGVSYEKIKTKYRQLAMYNHPDRGGSAERLAVINQAMDVLKRYYR